MKKLVFLLAFAMTLTFSFANESITTCGAPTNVTATNYSSGAISFDWDDCGTTCTGYEVQFVRLSDGYKSGWLSTSNSDYTFSGLQAGNYEFQFRTVCGGGVSSIIGIEDVITG